MTYSEQMKEICEKLGVNPEECKDNLYSTLLQTICDACGGSGGGSGVDVEQVIADYESHLDAWSPDTWPCFEEDENRTLCVFVNSKLRYPRDDAFAGNTRIRKAYLPNLECCSEWMFYESYKIEEVYIPEVYEIKRGAFAMCCNLHTVETTNAGLVREDAFSECSALTKLDFHYYTNRAEEKGVAEARAFYSCKNLTAIIFRNSTVMWDINLTALLGTKIADHNGTPLGEGFVYVPTALFEEYVSDFATKAKPLADGNAEMAEYVARAVLRKIEDYPEICG